MHPTITTAQLKATILNNVDKIDSLTNYCVSGGRLNAKKSVENIVHSHDRTTTTYVNLGYSQGHTETCSICDYSATTFHTWIKLTTGGLTTGYKCIGCNAYYKNIQIIHPVDGIIGADTNTLQEGNNTIIQISQHILLLCQNGQYSLLVQCDENMNISEDVLYEVPISWIRDILIANR